MGRSWRRLNTDLSNIKEIFVNCCRLKIYIFCIAMYDLAFGKFQLSLHLMDEFSYLIVRLSDVKRYRIDLVLYLVKI